ncbi:MAG: hypothetical protein [Podoviridae sp. ctg2L5]|nr:MAG: hypothetical protein [Podoviridae sp. ctg2L5]
MALTSGTKGFYFRKNMEGDASHPPYADFIIGNSKTITLGDAITLSGGYAQAASTNGRVVGVAVAIVDKNGLPVHGFSSHADHDGTVTGDDTFVSASDNATDKMVKVRVMMARSGDLYYNDADADLAQANIGSYFDMNSGADEIDVATATTSGVWQLVEIDPDNDSDASKGLFRVAERYFQDI